MVAAGTPSRSWPFSCFLPARFAWWPFIPSLKRYLDFNTFEVVMSFSWHRSQKPALFFRHDSILLRKLRPRLESLETRLAPAAGDLDLTFGSGGKTLAEFSSTGNFANAMAVQPDGRIVVVGETNTDFLNSAFGVARYNANGSLDSTFGSGGKVVTQLSPNGDRAAAVKIQTDGKIVVAGTTSDGSFDIFAIVRYNANGTLDTSFHDDGIVTLEFNSQNDDKGYALAIQADGKILVGGSARSFSNIDFALARLNVDGTLDATFAGGKVVTHFPGSNTDEIRDLIVQPDGNIVAVGVTSTGEGTVTIRRDYALARYNSLGSLDTSFSGDGLASFDMDGDIDIAYAGALQSDGKIVVAGDVYRFSQAGDRTYDDFGLLRVLPNGTLDTTFGTGGRVFTDFGDNYDQALDVAIQPDGKILAVGRANESAIGLARYLPSGALDATFGNQGTKVSDLSTSMDVGYGLGFGSNGTILVVGHTLGPTGFGTTGVLARYIGATFEPPAPPPITAVLQGRELVINGSSKADRIYVRQRSGRLSVDGIRISIGANTETSVLATAVSKIKINALGGDDIVQLFNVKSAGHQNIVIPTEIRGGAGKDTIYGGASVDTIYGGTEDDRIDGGKGNDILYGEAGKDTLLGDIDHDKLYGGNDNDTLYGGSGNDELHGQNHNDTLYGGVGNDLLYGNDGVDKLFGEGWNDKLYGGAGKDRLDGGDDEDYLDGGADADIVIGGNGIDTFRRSIFFSGFGLTAPKGEDRSPEEREDENTRGGVPVQVSGSFLSDTKPPTRDSMVGVLQQQSPVCSFLAALAAVADWSGRFPSLGAINQDLIADIKHIASNDSYSVPLYVNGKWQRISVNGDWTEAYMPSGHLWTTIYLKAYLKACNVATHTSTGAPILPSKWRSTTNAKWQDPQFALKTLIGPNRAGWSPSIAAELMNRRLRQGLVLVAVSLAKNTNGPIVANHSYAVYDVFKRNGAWVIKLYNPWGKDAPTATGTKAHTGANDGLIEIDVNTFARNFRGYAFA